MTTPNYDTDFYAWTQAQAAALRAKDWAAWTWTTWPRRSRAWVTEQRAVPSHLHAAPAPAEMAAINPTHRGP